MLANDPAAWSERARTQPTSWGAALWSEYGQRARFERALHHLQLQPGDRLLDFGCGTGAFSAFIPAGCDYLGVDSSAGMLERAQSEHREFQFSDTVEGLFSHAVAIGVWNLALDAEPEVISGIEHLIDFSSERVVVSVHRGLIVPERIAEIADVRWPGDWLLDCSYLDNDWMLVIRP